MVLQQLPLSCSVSHEKCDHGEEFLALGDVEDVYSIHFAHTGRSSHHDGAGVALGGALPQGRPTGRCRPATGEGQQGPGGQAARQQRAHAREGGGDRGDREQTHSGEDITNAHLWSLLASSYCRCSATRRPST